MCIVALKRSTSSVKGSKSLARIPAPFDRPMILLQIVVQVRTRSTAAAAIQISLLLQFCNHLRVGAEAVHLDGAS
jgi:hypothetical protein